jgi:hypothetical protein
MSDWLFPSPATGPVFEEEIHGPHPIVVREFDGFGPLGE